MLSSDMQGFSVVGDWQSGIAQVTCVHQDYFAGPPLWGDGLPADLVRCVWAVALNMSAG